MWDCQQAFYLSRSLLNSSSTVLLISDTLYSTESFHERFSFWASISFELTATSN
jgi:hypothetical protein